MNRGLLSALTWLFTAAGSLVVLFGVIFLIGAFDSDGMESWLAALFACGMLILGVLMVGLAILCHGIRALVPPPHVPPPSSPGGPVWYAQTPPRP